MGYTEEDLAQMSVESSDNNSQEYAGGGYVLSKHQTNPNVVKISTGGSYEIPDGYIF